MPTLLMLFIILVSAPTWAANSDLSRATGAEDQASVKQTLERYRAMKRKASPRQAFKGLNDKEQRAAVLYHLQLLASQGIDLTDESFSQMTAEQLGPLTSDLDIEDVHLLSERLEQLRLTQVEGSYAHLVAPSPNLVDVVPTAEDPYQSAYQAYRTLTQTVSRKRAWWLTDPQEQVNASIFIGRVLVSHNVTLTKTHLEKLDASWADNEKIEVDFEDIEPFYNRSRRLLPGGFTEIKQLIMAAFEERPMADKAVEPEEEPAETAPSEKRSSIIDVAPILTAETVSSHQQQKAIRHAFKTYQNLRRTRTPRGAWVRFPKDMGYHVLFHQVYDLMEHDIDVTETSLRKIKDEQLKGKGSKLMADDVRAIPVRVKEYQGGLTGLRKLVVAAAQTAAADEETADDAPADDSSAATDQPAPREAGDDELSASGFPRTGLDRADELTTVTEVVDHEAEILDVPIAGLEIAPIAGAPRWTPVAAALSDEAWAKLETKEDKQDFVVAQLLFLLQRGFFPSPYVILQMTREQREQEQIPFDPLELWPRSHEAFGKKGFAAALTKAFSYKAIMKAHNTMKTCRRFMGSSDER